MQIKMYLQPDKTLQFKLKRLVEDCAGLDGFTVDIDLDTSMNAQKDMPTIFTYEDEGSLKALLSIFAPMRDEIEVSALVHPEHRNKGLFRALVKEMAEECSRFGYSRGLFVCASEAGRRVMEHWGLGIDHVELQMSCNINDAEVPENTSLDITEAQESDIDSLASVGAAAFGGDVDSEREFIKNALKAENRIQYIAKKKGRAVGLCAASENSGSLMIYGLGVHPDERRKGYARALLRHIQVEAIKRGIFNWVWTSMKTIRLP